MQEPVIPDPSKALGQNMLQHQPEKVFALECSVLRLAGVAVNVFEGHSAVVIGNDVVFTDHTTVKIAREILQSGLASTDMFAINDPLLWQLAG